MKTAEERFWSKVQKMPSGCWHWIGARSRAGYGVFGLKNKNLGAHRFSWSLHRGTIPEGAMVCHRCDNPPCVNPEHLFLGTGFDNMRDMVSKNRHGNREWVGENHPNSRISENEAREIHRRGSSGESLAAISKDYGITREAVGSICLGKSWAHLRLPKVTSRKDKLSQQKADVIRALSASGTPQCEIAAAFGISVSLVCLIVANRRWKTPQITNETT